MNKPTELVHAGLPKTSDHETFKDDRGNLFRISGKTLSALEQPKAPSK